MGNMKRSTNINKISSTASSSRIGRDKFEDFERYYNQMRQQEDQEVDAITNTYIHGNSAICRSFLRSLFHWKDDAYRLTQVGKAGLQYIVDTMIDITFLPENFPSRSISELFNHVKDQYDM